jgi:flavodoxin
MPKILVTYATTHGHTGKLAARIGAALEQDGASIELLRLSAHHP